MAASGKYSRKHEAVLQCLRSTTTHPSADWVFQQLRKDFPEMSLGTVYRNLAQCKQRGEVRTVGFVGGFERFDARMDPHDHFVCRQCGRVDDLPPLPLPEGLDQLAGAQLDAQIDAHSLLFYGRCAACQAGDAQTDSPAQADPNAQAD